MQPRPVTHRDRVFWQNTVDQPSPARKVTFKCPDTLPDCNPLEAVVDDLGVIRIPWQISMADRELISKGGTVWLSILGGIVPPHDMHVVLMDETPDTNGQTPTGDTERDV